MRGAVAGTTTLLVLLGCLLSGWLQYAGGQEVPPERAFWTALSPFPAAKLMLDVRDAQLLHPEDGPGLLRAGGCTSLDGPTCTEAGKRRLMDAFPARLAVGKGSRAAEASGTGSSVKVKLVHKSLAPGQSLDDLLAQVVAEEAERASLLAESAALLDGKTVAEAKEVGEAVRRDYLEPKEKSAKMVTDADELADALTHALKALLSGDDAAPLLKGLEEALAGAVLEGSGRGGTAAAEEGQNDPYEGED